MSRGKEVRKEILNLSVDHYLILQETRHDGPNYSLRGNIFQRRIEVSVKSLGQLARMTYKKNSFLLSGLYKVLFRRNSDIWISSLSLKTE